MDKGIVDYLSRDPFIDPCIESELDEKFVVATINSFHETLDCMSSRLKGLESLNRNENVLDCSRRNAEKQSSINGCYDNQNDQKRTRLDRNERKQFSRLPKQLNTTVQDKQITFFVNSTQQTVVPKEIEIHREKKIPKSEEDRKNRLKERDVRKIQ